MEIQQEYMERYDGARTWNSIVDSRCKQEMLQFRSQVQELFATFEKEFHNYVASTQMTDPRYGKV